jgi:predicted Zn-dependent protease
VTLRSPSRAMLAVAVWCGLVVTGCADVNRARTQVDAATNRFHEQFNSGQFDAIYADAGSDFQKTGTSQQVEASLERYRAQLGPFRRVARSGTWTLNWTPTGSFVTMTDESTFAHGSAQEAFVWRVDRTSCRLVKYTVNNISTPTHVPVVTAARATRPLRFMPIHASLEHLEYLRRYYQEQLGLTVELLPELVTDRAAWTPDRRQWSAEGLANQVRQSIANDDAVVIGVTGEDIYLRSANWRFAFGWRADNRVAIVSYARMDPRFFSQPDNPDLLRRRLRHMVTKDLGLMLFGLEASPDPASPMYRDIGGIEELDAMGEDLAQAGFPTSVSFPSDPAEPPFLKCAPRVLGSRDTLVLSMSMPHPAELAITHPDGTPFFLVYEPDAHSRAESMPLYAREAFRGLREVKLTVADAIGTPWVAGRETNERIFTAPGVYEFRLTETLETEGLPIYRCKVRYNGERK